MAIINEVGDLTWLWVFMGVGAFLTGIATFVYAITTGPTRPRPRRHVPATQLDGSHERLGTEDVSADVHALV